MEALRTDVPPKAGSLSSLGELDRYRWVGGPAQLLAWLDDGHPGAAQLRCLSFLYGSLTEQAGGDLGELRFTASDLTGQRASGKSRANIEKTLASLVIGDDGTAGPLAWAAHRGASFIVLPSPAFHVSCEQGHFECLRELPGELTGLAARIWVLIRDMPARPGRVGEGHLDLESGSVAAALHLSELSRVERRRVRQALENVMSADNRYALAVDDEAIEVRAR